MHCILVSEAKEKFTLCIILSYLETPLARILHEFMRISLKMLFSQGIVFARLVSVITGKCTVPLHPCTLKQFPLESIDK